MPPPVVVLTNIPSPYQVELFDAVAGRGDFPLRAVYLEPKADGRRWEKPRVEHDHVVVGADDSAAAEAREWVNAAELVVVSNYRHPFAAELLRSRSASGRPWCFWGERPGFARLGPLGTLFRHWKLAALRRSRAAIWGIGAWAVDAYRREFGEQRPYFNVPYFSDLRRFAHSENVGRGGGRRFLYSGSLTGRKGVDLLASAFAELADENPAVELDIVGDGPLQPRMQAALSRCRERVRFRGFRQWAELPAAYHDADVLVAPSRYDGWGLIVPEGLASGLPVIGTDRTGAALELIRPGENGWRVRAGDRGDLLRALREATALGTDELRAWSRRAERSVEGHGLDDGAGRWADAARRSLELWG